MPLNPAIWIETFHRASREELGVALTVTHPGQAIESLHKHRPPGFSDYTVARPPQNDLIFIIKPGVALEDPEVVRELFHGGPDDAI